MSWDVPAVLTAFLAGLLGSGHCFGMCGGIAGTFGALAAGQGQRFAPALVFNVGRVLSYALLGGLGALLLGGAGVMLDVPAWSRILRIVTSAMILLIGLRFLFEISLLDRVERLGAGLWVKIRPLAVRLSARPGAGSRLLLGACWGFLPCGLVYTVLLTAASTAGFTSGASVMLAFGAGTLPSMLGVAWAAPALGTFLQDRWVRRLIGFSLVILALWSLSLFLGTGGSRMHH